MAIMWGTRFANASGESNGGRAIGFVQHEPKYNTGSWANHVYVRINAPFDNSYKVGDIVTVQTPTDIFTGPIWYIYESTSWFNLYVNPSSKPASSITDATSGTVYKGTSVPVVEEKPVVSTGYETVPLITVEKAPAGQTLLQAEVQKAEVADALAGNAELSKEVGPKTTSTLKNFAIPIILILLAGAGLVWWKLKKGKK